MQTAIEISLEEENKQFERIQFALKRANSDAAYIRTLEKLRHELKERLQDLGERVWDMPLSIVFPILRLRSRHD